MATKKKAAARTPRKPDAMADTVLPHAYTDEGLAERAAKRKYEPVDVRVTRDAHDGMIEARFDACEGKLETWEAPDPNRELTEKYVKPGFRGRFLSPATIDKRGTRGFEPVVDERGEPVKLGRMILGQMPEERAQKRDRHYQAQADEAVADMNEKQMEQQERIARQAQGGGLDVIRPGSVVTDHHTDRSGAVGIELRRGSRAYPLGAG